MIPGCTEVRYNKRDKEIFMTECLTTSELTINNKETLQTVKAVLFKYTRRAYKYCTKSCLLKNSPANSLYKHPLIYRNLVLDIPFPRCLDWKALRVCFSICPQKCSMCLMIFRIKGSSLEHSNKIITNNSGTRSISSFYSQEFSKALYKNCSKLLLFFPPL